MFQKINVQCNVSWCMCGRWGGGMRRWRPPPITRSPSPQATPHVILATEVRAETYMQHDLQSNVTLSIIQVSAVIRARRAWQRPSHPPTATSTAATTASWTGWWWVIRAGRSVTNVRPCCRYAMVWALWYTQQPCQMLILTSLTGTCNISINSSGSTAPVGVLLLARLSRLGPPSRRLGGRRGGSQSRPAAACSQSSRLRGEKVGHHIPIISSSGVCKFQ